MEHIPAHPNMTLDQALAWMLIVIAGSLPALLASIIAYIKAHTAILASAKANKDVNKKLDDTAQKLQENTDLTEEVKHATKQASMKAETAVLKAENAVIVTSEATKKIAKDHEERITQAEHKSDMTWSMIVQRAHVEAKSKGLLDSEGNPTQKARNLFKDDMLAEMRHFYQTIGFAMPIEALLLEFQARWGKELAKRVCEPAGLFHGGCLLVASILAQEGQTHKTISGKFSSVS